MQLLIIILILSNLLSQNFIHDKPPNTYFDNPLIDWDSLNEEENTEINEYPLIEFQPTLEPAKKESYEDLLGEISTLYGSFSEIEVRLLRLQESIEQHSDKLEHIESLSKEQEEKQRRREEEKQNNRDSEGTISTYLLGLFIFLLGALSISGYKNIKLLKKRKEYARAKEEKQSVETQTRFYRLDESEDEIGVSDQSSSEESSDLEENKKGKKTKKKRFGFNVRKCFCRCLKLKRKKNKQNEKTLEETSDESEESDESINVPAREKNKRGRNFLIYYKKRKALESEDRKDGKCKRKRFGLKIGKYFYRHKQAKKCRKVRHKKLLWKCCHQKASSEEEETLDEMVNIISESSDETYTTSSEITTESSYETAESNTSTYVKRRGKIKCCTLTIILCCKKHKSLDSENKQDETSYETAESDQFSIALPREKIKSCSLNILLCYKKINTLDSDDKEGQTSSYEYRK